MENMSNKKGCTCLRHDASRREFLRLFGIGSLGLLTSRFSFADAPATSSGPGPVKYYGAFSELPVGAVKPKGWIQKWLERQAQGLSGHPENMAYPYDTCMYAGVIPPPAVKHGQDWWPYEQSGYHYDATARLNQLIDDPIVKQRHQTTLDYILGNSTDMGYGASTWGWPNAVVGRGLLADYTATGNQAIASIMQKYLVTHADPVDRDGVNAEEAFYFYGLTGDPQLLAYAQSVYDAYTGPKSFCSVDKINGTQPFKSHGVTAAEFLKILPLNYLYTGNPQALELTKKAYDKIVSDSLMPDGGIVSSESLGITAFNSLHESCDISDWSWSMGYCFMATGDAKWADLIERTIFNALPGAVTKDFKQAQYFSDANQVLVTSLCNHASQASTRMSYRAAHDTECCVGNINRAMPNYVIRQWMRTPDGGLAAIYYGPSEVTTTLNGQQVTLAQETEYPFKETITFRVKTASPVTFGLQLRIPGWCPAAKIAINGQDFSGKTDPGTFALLSREFKDGDVIQLTLPMQLRMEDWFQGQSVALARGPLVFSLKIDEKRVELTKDTHHIESVLKGNLIQGFPAVEFYPQSEWRYGIDPGTKSNLDQIKVVESAMTDNPFLSDQTPVHLELPLRHLPNWQPDWNPEPAPLPNGDPVVVKNPAELPSAQEQQNAEAATTKIMIPYGATYLRLTTLPLVAS
jgi:hypothetical protein